MHILLMTNKTYETVGDTVSTTLPTPNPIVNSGVINYNNASGNPVSFVSTTASTTINMAILTSTKQVSSTYANIGDVLTYTIPIRNTGNVTANALVFIDTIPNGTQLVSGSYRQDSTLLTGSPSPPGTTLPNGIAPNATSTVVFQVQVTTIPIPNPITNAATATANYLINASTTPNLFGTVSTNSNSVTTSITTSTNPSKQVNKTLATLGDTLQYTLVWTNQGGATQTNIIFIDTLPTSSTFQTNSIWVNGTQQLGATITPPSGLNTGTLPVGSTVTVTFIVQIVTIPSSNQVINQGILQKTEGGVTTQYLTNSVTTDMARADLSGITKSVDKVFADCGDTLTYTIDLPNSGNLTATNVVFRDTIPNGTTLVSDSVYVNGTQQLGANPQSGINIPAIAPGATSSVTYSIKIQC